MPVTINDVHNGHDDDVCFAGWGSLEANNLGVVNSLKHTASRDEMQIAYF